MTEPDPTLAADKPPSAAAHASPPGDGTGFGDGISTGADPDASISGVAQPPSAMPAADPMAAFYAARWPSEEDTGDRRYRGRRRAKVAEPTFWVGTLTVLALVGGLLYWALSKAPLPSVGSPMPSESASASLPNIAVGPSGSASIVPSATSATPTAGPSSTAPPPFKPITIEAESGTIGGSAEVVRNNRASGKHIVQQLGNWGSGTPGTLTIVTAVLPTAGTYTLRISYLHTDGEPTRSAIITVNSVALPARTFRVNDGRCCYTMTIGLTLQAGKNTIVFSNPTGHAPGLDKFVITRPG
jgi:hypothetical protein